jgi:hypothetical protein
MIKRQETVTATVNEEFLQILLQPPASCGGVLQVSVVMYGSGTKLTRFWSGVRLGWVLYPEVHGLLDVEPGSQEEDNQLLSCVRVREN